MQRWMQLYRKLWTVVTQDGSSGETTKRNENVEAVRVTQTHVFVQKIIHHNPWPSLMVTKGAKGKTGKGSGKETGDKGDGKNGGPNTDISSNKKDWDYITTPGFEVWNLVH